MEVGKGGLILCEVYGLVFTVEEEGCGQAHGFGKWVQKVGLLRLAGWWGRRAVTIGMGGFGWGSGLILCEVYSLVFTVEENGCGWSRLSSKMNVGSLPKLYL